MKVIENERRDWVLVLAILLFGVLCVLLAATWAIRFSPSWRSDANMGSNLDPNVSRPGDLVEALDPAILTQPTWINVFLTPGASVPTRPASTQTAVATQTSPPAQVTKVTPGFTGSPTNTQVYFFFTSTFVPNPGATKTSIPQPPSTATATAAGTPTATATATFTAAPQADLQVTINDNETDYEANASIQYTLIVSNLLGPASVIGATVTVNFSGNLTNVTWTCSAPGGASCTANGTGNISDTVDLPKGTSATYIVQGTVVSSPSGDLVSIANIASPADVTDPVPGNNSSSDTDTLIVPDVTPPQIGSGPDNNIYVVPSGGILTLQLSTAIVVTGGNDGWDLIYYEWPQGTATTTPGIWMDCVVLQVSDGKNWYTILNWGDNLPDTNASMNMNTIGAGAETDNLPVDASLMYNATGIAVELDKVIPNGTYKYIRIISPFPPLDDGDGAEVDGITILP